MTRIYQPTTIITNSLITLDDNAYNHLVRALRIREGDEITLFDGNNYIVPANVVKIDKKSIQVQTQDAINQNRESPLQIHLGQVVSRGDKMEFTIQKSVELGVNIITPLFSERCGVKLDSERLDKKIQQWQKIAQSACEQCGRNVIPLINPVTKLEDWCNSLHDITKLTLHPRAHKGINTLTLPNANVALLIGPEGGLSDDEIAMTTQYNFTEITLGPRVLRTETAGLAAITALQVKFGDLG